MTPQSYGLVWHKGKLRYFKEFRPIRNHKGQERVMIVLSGKEVKINVNSVKRYPREVSKNEAYI